ncbi:thiol-disulfide oxidoreductase DCC family protein [Paenibacillus solisilvae]|uniref:Thiol-disulfide oxidoreductase DCC family protein n=1 Tax=Paenibacillus solisilvae TaxID=2486751 RepID=A0ABW0W107_9BACL
MGRRSGTSANQQVREKLYVIYDGTCNLCLTTVRRLKELRSNAVLRFVSVQSLEDSYEEIPNIESIPTERLMSKMHVVEQNGAIYAGADGVVRILHTVRGFTWLGLMYRIPGMRGIADLLYRFIAARRYDWFGKTDESCENGACNLPRRH